MEAVTAESDVNMQLPLRGRHLSPNGLQLPIQGLKLKTHQAEFWVDFRPSFVLLLQRKLGQKPITRSDAWVLSFSLVLFTPTFDVILQHCQGQINTAVH